MTSVSVATPDPNIFEPEVRKLLTAFKAVEFPPTCQTFIIHPPDVKSGTSLVTINVWIAQEDVPQLKEKLAAKGKIPDWKENPTQINGIAPDVEERWRLLSRELADAASLLARVPYIQSLTRAEVARLEPFAKSYLETKDKTHVQLILYIPR